MPIYSVQGPDGRVYDLEGPEGTTTAQLSSALQTHLNPPEPAPQAPAKPAPKPGMVESGLAGLAGGFANTGLGAGAALADYAGANNAASYLDEKRKAVQDWQQQHGGDTTTGKVASMVGGLAPAALEVAAAPFTGGSSLLPLVANAGLFALPAFRDTYKEQLAAGAPKDVAIEHALAQSGMALVGGQIVGRAGNALKLGEGMAGQVGKAAAEGAGFDVASKALEKGIDVANNRQNDTQVFDPASMAENAAAFGLLRGATHHIESGRLQKAQADQQAAADQAAADQKAQAAQADADHKASPAYAQQITSDYLAAEQAYQQAKAGLTKPDPASPTYAADHLLYTEKEEKLAELKAQRDELAKPYVELVKAGRIQTPEQKQAALETPANQPTASAPIDNGQRGDQGELFDSTGSAKPKEEQKPLGRTPVELAQKQQEMEKLLEANQTAQSDAAAAGDRAQRNALAAHRALLQQEYDAVSAQLQAAGGYGKDSVLAKAQAQHAKLLQQFKDMAGPGYDPVLADKLEAKISALEEKHPGLLGGDADKQTELPLGKADQTQSVESKENFAARTPKEGPHTAAESEEEEARRNNEQQIQDAILAANAEKLLAPERNALHKMGDKDTTPTGFTPETNAQMGLFGEHEGTPSSAAMGQMQQKLTGEDVTHTAPAETETGPGKGPQKGGPAPFKLYARREGTGEPLTRDGILDRAYELENRQDLSPEAVQFLQRVRGTVTNDPHVLDLYDQQLSKIESGEEGVRGAGAGKPEDVNRPVRGPQANTAAPSAAEGRPQLALRKSTDAQKLQLAKKAKYDEGIKQGLTPTEAARRASLVKAEENSERTEASGLPVRGKAVESVMTPETLRGPSAQAKPLSIPDELEEHMRLQEGARRGVEGTDNSKQKELFPTDEKEQGTIRATPQNLQKYFESKGFKDMLAEQAKAKETVITGERVGEFAKQFEKASAELDKMLAKQDELKKTRGVIKENKGLGVVAHRVDQMRAQMGKLFIDRTALTAQIDTAQARLEHLQKDLADLEAYDPQGWPSLKNMQAKRIADLRAVTEKSLQQMRDLRAEQDRIEAIARDMEAKIKLGTAQQEEPELRRESSFGSEIDAKKKEADEAKNRLMLEQKAASEKKAAQDKAEADQRRAKAAVERTTASDFARQLSEEHTRLWNAIHSGEDYRDQNGVPLPRTQYRALTKIERTSRWQPKDGSALVKFASELEDKPVSYLHLELGKLDKLARAAEQDVRAAKERSASFQNEALKKVTAGKEQSFADLGIGQYLEEASIESEAAPKDGTAVTFKGLGAALRLQSQLAVRREAIENAIERRTEQDRANAPRSKEVGAEETAKPANRRESDELGMRVEQMQEIGTVKDRIASLEETLKDEGLTDKHKQSLSAELIKAKEELAGLEKKQGPKGPAQRTVEGAPAKLRGGTDESKNNPGNVKSPITETPKEKQPTLAQAVAAGNQASAEKQAAEKPPTKKEIRAMSRAQQDALAKIAADKVGELQSKLANVKERIESYGRLVKKNPDVLDRLLAEKKATEDMLAHARVNAKMVDAETTKTESEEAAPPPVLSDKAGEAEDQPNKPSADRKFTPVSDKVREAAHDGRLMDVADELAKNGSTPEVRAAAAKLKGMLLRTKLEVDPNVKYKGETVPGLYSPSENKITMHPDGLTEEDLLHEMTHAATDGVLLTDPKKLTPDQRAARAGLEALHKSIENSAHFEDEHGKANVGEFVSEVMSNPEFRAKLDAFGKPLSLMDRFKNLLRRLVGLPPKGPSDKAKDFIDKILTPSRKAQNALLQPSLFRGTKYDERLKNAGALAERTIATQRPLAERLKANATGRAALEFETNIVDGHAGVNAHTRKMDSLAGTQVRYYLDMVNQRLNLLGQAIGNGFPELRKIVRPDGRSEFLYETPKERVALQDVAKTLQPAHKLTGGEEATHNLFSLYEVAKRSGTVGLERLNYSGEITQAQLDGAMHEIKSVPGLQDIFDRASDRYKAFNQDAIRFGIGTGAFSKELGAKMLANKDYVPYYRESSDGTVSLWMGSEQITKMGNTKDQPYLHELVGGDKRILDFATSSIRNANMIMEMGLRNQATKNTAYELKNIGLADVAVGDRKAGPNTLHFKVDGVPHYAVVKDTPEVPAELLVKGMAGLPVQQSALMKLAGMPSRLLRHAFVANPVSAARILFKDTLSSAMVSGSDLSSIGKALKNVNENLMERRGISGGEAFTGLPADMANIYRQIQSGKPRWEQLMSKAYALHAKADALTRQTRYESYRKQGLSELEATYKALDSMNFTRRGISPSVHMLNTLNPFINSQIQGINQLVKGIRGTASMEDKLNIRAKLFQRGMMVAGGTLLYAMAQQDDPAYQNATPDQKYNNFFMRVPGMDEPLRIPIPFEAGMLFKSVPEAMVNLAYGNSKDAKAGMQQMAQRMIPGGDTYGIPQVLRPGIEAFTDHSFYTGRSIQSRAEQGESPEARVRDNTSGFAKALGEQFGMSPVLIDHLIGGYTGQLGLAVAQMSSHLVFGGDENGPAKNLSQEPAVGSLFQPEDAGQVIENAYQMAQEAQQVHNTVSNMAKKGQGEAAEAFLNKHADAFAKAQIATQFTGAMSKMQQAANAIKASTALTPEEKRDKLKELQQARTQIAARVLSASDAYERGRPSAP